VPLQQIFEVNEHHKHRFLSEVTKRTISNNGCDNLNFVKYHGRKSIKKDERTPSRTGAINILPFKIKGNESVKEDRPKFFNKKYSKEITSGLADRFHEHPMIINQMSNPRTISRLSESNPVTVPIPVSPIRDVKLLRAAESFTSHTAADSK
jgi:hypothetical protein